MQTAFLNVDLDIEGPQDLAPFVAALGEDVFNLHTGPLGTGFHSHLELAGDMMQPETPEAGIQGFLTLLGRLTPEMKRLWDGATKRDFNIGIQGGTEPRFLEISLSPQTLSAIAASGARVVVTVYAVDLESKSIDEGHSDP